MRHLKLGSLLAAFAAIVLTACGGGGGDSGGSSGGNSNKAPIANAGAMQVVAAGALVTLNGSASSDPDGTIASYAWTQTAGTTVTLAGASNAQPSFTAPSLSTETTLRFALVVTDNRGATSTPSTVQIIVNAVAGNMAPIANAGSLQSTTSGTAVMLNGAASTDLDGSIVSYAWTQTAGPAVTLSSTAVALPSFIAPPVAGTETLTFSLVVTDDDGAASTPSTVHITVNPGTPGNVNVAGKVRFERVRFKTTAPRPLDYAAPVLQPARGVTVRALDAVSEVVITTSWTDMNGDYSLSVPANSNVIVEVEARMQKTGPAPTWDMRVQNGVPGTSPYTHRTASFNSDTGVTRNIDIATGVNASGQATGTRASAPFAILDTLYTGMQFIMGAAPTASFPVLVVDWGTQNQGTFFSTFNGQQHIALLSDLSEDTDEFDQHVIAHEFGHYIEYNFSRADNIGGQHGLGDRLDPRVAFGEGFGYAFAAMVLNDPMARDSFVNNGTLVSGGFNVETNPTTNPPGAGSDREGCWCSESSVWSILYDLYDDAADGADTLSLGFTPIWKVLVGPQRTTPAFTTIFSFITALKAERPSDIAAINALVAAQNIDAATIDAFASTETHFPSNVAQTAALPLYTTMSLNSTATLLNVNDAGRYNKLGNHRWVRFTVPAGGRSVTITVATSNATDNDPDFLLWRGGIIGGSEEPPPGPETQTFSLSAGTYLLDVYDCANGCTSAQGTAGDYNLTVTLSAP